MASKGAVVTRSSASHRRVTATYSGTYTQVHHGGAGTTASGLRAGNPPTRTKILLFPARDGFDNVKLRAMELREQIENEDGVEAAVDAFHRHLPPQLPIPPPPPPPPPPPDDGPPNLIRWLPQFVFHALHGPPCVLAILYYVLIVIFVCVNMG
ncbi:hypothetical protein C4D60_Mb08t32410 [Musa balbisiana]|uniref:Uncharacterized protein n=1 Tax=Musa balbisiana TaxID=52838 RepID=A0A4S8K838_MUSBA|nr:hypothetical protein C4D60_Mb08t32410 [Musa balbisiana]